MSAERDRVEAFGKLEDGLLQAGDWYLWGPYLSERQWGTVREDYSSDGEAWGYFPHDHARSRAYRWGEDGLAGFSDVQQRLCLSLALWNGRDPILKERIFGLTGNEGNHGEDAKEYWWFTDAIPSHALNRWRYHYPQSAFPYDDLVAENGLRDKHQGEYELLDTGAFDDDRFWVVEVEYTKDGPDDLLMTVRVINAGPDTETLHVLPTLWFRNTWSWGDDDEPAPRLRAGAGSSVEVDHPVFGDLELLAGPGPDGSPPELLFCENETNTARLFGSPDSPAFPKDGINDHVLHGASTVNPDRDGTKAAAWYQASVASQETVELRLRLRPRGGPAEPFGATFDGAVARRRAEADEFYAELTPAGTTPDEALVMRQAFAGMLWSKQLYSYNVARWLDGDPGGPVPPASRKTGRNRRWRNFDAFDIMSMPDTWEYPWFAAWDLAFHCVALAHIDPAFAKYQLILICREWFQHPSGALPAYEWSFDDLNPPVQAWAALEVFAIDGSRDLDFLRRVFDKLLVNFTWWINREDADGSNLFEGGFLGLDNIGPIDRDKLPVAGRLEQSDATAWMALYSLHMATMASVLHRQGGQPTQDLTIKFLEHFALIKGALDDQGLWDDVDGFFYDRIELDGGERIPVKVRSMVGILPVLAGVVVDEVLIHRLEILGKGFVAMLGEQFDPTVMAEAGLVRGTPGERQMLIGVVGVDRIRRLFDRLFDEGEFLSPYGMRAVSAAHRDHPYELDIGELTASIDYEPAESTTAMFGGNSNWRGPIWFPLNFLLVSSMKVYGTYFGDGVLFEYPTGSGVRRSLTEISEDLRQRLISLFTLDAEGRRPCYGRVEVFRDNPHWQGLVQYHEYFHGDNGAGLGASHQTGWTGVVADLIRRRPGSGVASLSDLLRPRTGSQAAHPERTGS